MTYQVLARKWRPKSFAELVGQDHVVRALVNGLEHDRVHHAFLFSGTRGVGKTTIARILAKALNCQVGVSSQPCGQCKACQAIDAGRFVDLIEVDAASRTKVDDTRELLENVQYAPSSGRYKVYLIDEVHMLSTHSFNALLKTLEEPPPHVKFLLATTDPQKLPVTVLSRCLQFNLKRLPVAQIEAYLRDLLATETIVAEADAVHQIAVAADGSMRDGLSLLDQAIAYGGGTLSADDVRRMLGTVERKHLAGIVEALCQGDANLLWSALTAMAEYTPDYAGVLAELGRILHRAALAQLLPECDDNEADDGPLVSRIAQAMDPQLVQLCYEISLRGRRDIDLAPDPRTGFEMSLLRMLAFQHVDGSEPDTKDTKQAPPASATPKPAPPEAIEATVPAALEKSPSPAADATAVAPPTDWAGLIQRLGLKGAARVLASNSVLQWREHGHYLLRLKPSLGHLHTQAAEQKVKQALTRCFGKDIKVEFKIAEVEGESPAQHQSRIANDRQAAATAAVQDDATVQALKDAFGAQLIVESIQPAATHKPKESQH